MADQALPGYPTPIGGSTNLIITTHQGTNNYQAGGETVNASTFGWGRFDRVAGSSSFNANNTGNYSVQVLYPVGQTPALNNNAFAGVVPTGSNSVKLKWVAANGTEAANNSNLQTEFVRMEYVGG